MRRVFPLFLVLLLLFSVPVYAAEDETAGDIEPSADEPVFNGADEKEVVEDVPVSQETDTLTENVAEILTESTPVYVLESEETAVTDSTVISAVSVYDLAASAGDADNSVCYETVYTLTPVGFDPEFIDWFFSDGYFRVVLTDAFFNFMVPPDSEISKEQFLTLLGSYTYTLTVNDVFVCNVTFNVDDCSVSFPYSGDGEYVIVLADDGLDFFFHVSITSETVTVPSSDVSFVSTLKALFGTYTPKTYNVTTYLSDGTAVHSTEIVSGLAGLDYEWITSVALFSLVLYGLLRMIGGLLKQ